MRRRRQKNPLLGKIIGISVLVHVILLPILGYYAVINKRKQEHLVQMQMVMLPPPATPKEKPIVKKETKTAKAKTVTPSKSKTSPNHGPPHVAHNNLPSPKLELAKSGAGGSDDSNSAEQGNGKQGVVPTDTNIKKPEVTKADNTTSVEKQPEKPVVPEVKQPEKPVVAVPVKQPEVTKVPEQPVKPVVTKVPVFTAAQPLDDSQPKPSIPDALRSDALDKTVVVEFTVGEDGSPMAVKAVQSTGNDELDRRALDAARKWRFKPATRDGQPVVGKVRLFIEFQVS